MKRWYVAMDTPRGSVERSEQYGAVFADNEEGALREATRTFPGEWRIVQRPGGLVAEDGNGRTVTVQAEIA